MSAQTLQPILLLLLALIYCCEATQSHCSVHSDCQSCVQDGTFLGPCRWCVHDNACHDAGAIITNPCKKVENIVSLAAPNGCDCVKAYNDVMNRRDELVKRIQDIIADDRELPVTGKFSVASHVDQLQQKQVNMRRLLTTFDNLQCKQDTENAESLAAAPVPSTAKTAQLNNVPESKLNALAEVLGLSAVALAIVFAAPALIEASALAAFCAAFLPATDASTSSETGQPNAGSPSSPSSAQLAGIVVGCVAAAAVVVGAGAVVFRRRKVRAEQERAEQMTANPLNIHESDVRYSAL